MSELTLKDLAKAMADIDFTMMVTRTADGGVTGRPMSNNGDVDYDGDSFYFSWEASRKVDDIKRDPHVGLTFQGRGGLLGKPPMMIAVEGAGELVHDKAAFAAHWTPDLERWFENGIDTPGMVMIKVRAARIRYWDGEHEGEIAVPQ